MPPANPAQSPRLLFDIGGAGEAPNKHIRAYSRRGVVARACANSCSRLSTGPVGPRSRTGAPDGPTTLGTVSSG